ncbi:MAG TPA: ATP-dependent helicase [Actinocrinis sp.]|nr:ATP-dependent helicase [Actinocrinis sp.]
MSADAAEIAASDAAALLVIAPPGTGKTELLALRATHLIERLGPHQQILALTFSNKARRNLGERLLRALGPARFRRYVQVRNFHGHAAEIVRSHGRTLGLDPAFPMPDRRTLARALDAAAGTNYAARTAIEQALGEAKREPRDDAEVDALLAATNYQALPLERNRVASGLVHYNDLLRHAQRLLRVEQVAALYQAHYGAVLVDEFQDLSWQQLDIALRSCSANRTFVGDPQQGIYSWAGARPLQVEAHLRQLCGDAHALTVSYRSSPAVLNVVNAASAHLGAQPLRAAEPDAWPGGGAACALAFDTGDAEAEAIVELCARISQRHSAATIGVIVRAGWRRTSLDAAFERAPQVRHYRWDLAIDDAALAERLHQAYRALAKTADIDALRPKVLDGIDPADVDTYQQALEALDLLAERAASAGSVAGAMDQLLIQPGDRPIEAGTHVLTAHTGKGQQFDWVIIPGMEEGHIPAFQASTAEAIAEEQCVLHVMLSRARHGIVLTCARQLTSHAGRPYTKERSRWWPLAAAPCTLDWNSLTAHIDDQYKP